MNKKLFELDEGTPDGSMKFAYGKAGEAAKNITLDNLKDLIVPPAGTLKTMVVNIGAWNMNTTEIFPIFPNAIYLYSGLTLNYLPVIKIRKITITILSDDKKSVTDLLADKIGTYTSPILAINVVQHNIGDPLVIITNTTITLARLNGGMFDNVNYSTATNRGWITVDYIE